MFLLRVIVGRQGALTVQPAYVAVKSMQRLSELLPEFLTGPRQLPVCLGSCERQTGTVNQHGQIINTANEAAEAFKCIVWAAKARKTSHSRHHLYKASLNK